ncbi:MAG: MBL fold metallo-hydrolase [Chitinophagaceae bacterium]
MAILISILVFIGVFIMTVRLFVRQPKFGVLPAGDRLQEIEAMPNYRDGKFMNQSHTPDLTEGVSYYKVLREFLFDKSNRIKPSGVLPSKKTDLLTLEPDRNVMVWFGHSSYFLQVDGKKILVDPVLSGAASPVRFTTKSYKGSDVYTTDELPEIDYLFLTHDHWDHLDYDTVIKLRRKTKNIICGLGVGAHLEHWGLDKHIIIEKNWGETAQLGDGFTVHVTPARHFSGRGFKRQSTLWASYVLQTASFNIFLGGDSGYDTHFATIGETFGPFDLAILECGQYNANWKYIHMMPEETVQAAIDLKAAKLVPVHWAKFSLGQHAWDEPIIRATSSARAKGLPILTPMIGEALNLDGSESTTDWWLAVDSRSKI